MTKKVLNRRRRNGQIATTVLAISVIFSSLTFFVLEFNMLIFTTVMDVVENLLLLLFLHGIQAQEVAVAL